MSDIIIYIISQVYSEVSRDPYKFAAEDQTKAMSGEINIHFPALKEWMESYIKDVYTKVNQRTYMRYAYIYNIHGQN